MRRISSYIIRHNNIFQPLFRAYLRTELALEGIEGGGGLGDLGGREGGGRTGEEGGDGKLVHV